MDIKVMWEDSTIDFVCECGDEHILMAHEEPIVCSCGKMYIYSCTVVALLDNQKEEKEQQS